MSDPQKNHIKIDPGTLVLIVSALILLPLLITGFLSQ
jgi:preprotein translocase subunit Sec61beta